jgi:hypothetical protein
MQQSSPSPSYGLGEDFGKKEVRLKGLEITGRESRNDYASKRKSRKVLKITGITLASMLVILILIAVDPFSNSVSVSPVNLYFTVDDGLNPAAQIIEMGSSRGTVAWSAIDDARWLSLEPASGNADKETPITVSIDISGMYLGEYFATITISAPDAKNTPLEVPVSLVVTETVETLAIKETVAANRDNVKIYYDTQPPYCKTLGEPIHLINSDSATNPTWEQLMAFLIGDKADQRDYSLLSHPCGAFAEEVHNNAEAAGIRSAWVAVDFEDDSESHALDAFITRDKGLVFVDCTSAYRSDLPPLLVRDPITGEVEEWKSERLSSYDKIAYVVVGKEYGLISLGVAASAQYSFYEAYLAKRENYESKLGAYNQEVDAYNQALGGRVYLYEPSIQGLWNGIIG